MGDKGRAASKQGDDYSERRAWMTEHLNCKQSAANRTNDSVNNIPGGVDPWNFIGEKFEEIENTGDCDDPRVAEDLERLILRRQSDPVKMDGESTDENREVKIDAGERGEPESDSKQVKFLHEGKYPRM